MRQKHGPPVYNLDWLPFQREFIDDWTHATQFECWGVGTGKSVSGAAKALTCGLLWPGCHIGCFEPTQAMLDTVMYPAINEVVEAFKAVNGFDPVVKRTAYTKTWTLFNGSSFRFFSAHKPERIVGATLGAIWLDEESSYENSDALVLRARARLRGRGPGILWCTSTPNGRQGLLAEVLETISATPEGEPCPSVLRVHSSYDNPHLPPGFIPSLEKTYSGPMFQQEVLALVGSGTNLVYSGFARDKHCRPFDRQRLKSEPGWDLCIGLDWSGGAAEGAIVWAAVREQGDGKLPAVVILDEWVGVASNPQMIQRVIESLNKYPNSPAMVCPDPADFDGVADLRAALKKIYPKRGLVKWETEYRRKRVPYGVELLNRLIASADGGSSFVVDHKLIQSFPHGFVAACEHYRTKNGKIYDDNIYTHILDAARYIALNCHRIGHKIRGQKLSDQAALRQARRVEDEDADE